MLRSPTDFQYGAAPRAKSPTDFQYQPPRQVAKSPTDFQYRSGTARPATRTGLTFGNSAPRTGGGFSVANLGFGGALQTATKYLGFDGGGDYSAYKVGTPITRVPTGLASTNLPEVNTVDIDGGAGVLDGLRDMASGILDGFGGGEDASYTQASFGGDDGLLTPVNIALMGGLAFAAYYAFK